MMGTQHKVVGIGFGLATALYAAEVMNEPGPAIVALATSTVGCMLPDMDHDRTKIGRKRKLVTDITSKAMTILSVLAIVGLGTVITATAVGMINSNVNLTTLITGLIGLIGFLIIAKWVGNTDTVKWMCKHRGFMHTLIPQILMILVAFSSDLNYWQFAWLGLAIGYGSHLLADMLTVEGCPILWPLSRHNIRILKLKTINKTTWLAALALAALPIVVVYYISKGI